MNDILKDVFSYYRQNFYTLISFIVPVSLTITIISIAIAYLFADGNPELQLKIVIVCRFMLEPILIGGLTYLIVNILYERKVSLIQCLIYGLYFWIPLLAVTFVHDVLTLIGIILFIFPGLWISSRLILAPFLVVLEQSSPLNALSDSYHKTEDEIWRIMGTTLLVFLSTFLIRGLVSKVLPDNIIGELFGSVIRDILSSFFTVLWFRFYDLIINGK